MPIEPFDASRVRLQGPDFFKRFPVADQGIPLRTSDLPKDTEIIVIERQGTHRAFVVLELMPPHAAQGTLAHEPYLVSF